MVVSRGECGKVNSKEISESCGCQEGISLKDLAEVFGALTEVLLESLYEIIKYEKTEINNPIEETFLTV